MIIGAPREIKDNENRVGLTADGAAALVEAGHELRVERGAGLVQNVLPTYKRGMFSWERRSRSPVSQMASRIR